MSDSFSRRFGTERNNNPDRETANQLRYARAEVERLRSRLRDVQVCARFALRSIEERVGGLSRTEPERDVPVGWLNDRVARLERLNDDVVSMLRSHWLVVDACPDACPACGRDLRGAPIPEEETGLFGTTHFTRRLGIFCGDTGIEGWRCPDCAHEWVEATVSGGRNRRKSASAAGWAAAAKTQSSEGLREISATRSGEPDRRSMGRRQRPQESFASNHRVATDGVGEDDLPLRQMLAPEVLDEPWLSFPSQMRHVADLFLRLDRLNDRELTMLELTINSVADGLDMEPGWFVGEAVGEQGRVLGFQLDDQPIGFSPADLGLSTVDEVAIEISRRMSEMDFFSCHAAAQRKRFAGVGRNDRPQVQEVPRLASRG
jgi:hypothetical protein